MSEMVLHGFRDSTPILKSFDKACAKNACRAIEPRLHSNYWHRPVSQPNANPKQTNALRHYSIKQKRNTVGINNV